MKVLKKYFKVVLCFMAFALCSFMFAFTPSISAAMAVNYTIATYNAAINAIKMPTTEVDYSKTGAKFRIPLLENYGLAEGVALKDSTEDYTIRVIDPAGYAHDYTIDGQENDASYFKGIEEDTNDNNKKYLVVNAKNDGDYKVIYIVKTGTGDSARTFYSNTYKVTVKNVSYELDFTTAVYDAEDVDGDSDTTELLGYDYKLIKTRLQKSDTAYEIPVAYAKVVGGDVTNIQATIKVTKNGAPQTLNDTANKSIFKSAVVDSQTKYYIIPNETGVYTIEYSYENSVNRPTKTYTINVVDSFEASKLTLETKDPTFKEITLGKKDIELPKLTFSTDTETNVDVNVKSIVIEKEDNSAIKCVLRNNNFKFDMTTSAFGASTYADMVGNYIVTYNVVDAYGKTATESFVINGITVTSKPTIALSYDYDVTKADFRETVALGAETELRTEYVAGNSIVFPAAYVDDVVTTDFSKFTIIRTFRKGSQNYYIDNKKYDEATGKLVDVAETDIGYNAAAKDDSLKANIGDPTKAVQFKFSDSVSNTEGTYYIEYSVISNEVKADRETILYKSGTSDKYTFKIVASADHKATTPTITIDNLNDDTVKSTDKVSVNITATDTLDTRLLKTVMIYTTEKAGNTLTLEQNIRTAIGTADRSYGKTEAIYNSKAFKDAMSAAYNDFSVVDLNTETGAYDLDLSTLSGTVKVVALAINDDGNIKFDEKEITLKDTITDETAPKITINAVNDNRWLVDPVAAQLEIKEFEVGQGEEIKLPTVYVDDADKELTLNVSYYIDSPENSFGAIDFRSPVGKSFGYTTVGPNKYQVIKGGTITTSETGVYYVAYSATDIAGNTNVMYFTFVVKDTSKPVLNVEAVGDDLTQTGNTVEAGKGAVVDFESTLRSADGKNDYTNDAKTTINIDVDTNGVELDWQVKEGKYVFNDYGTYVVTISGEYDGRDADEKVIRVVISKEEIKWLNEFDVPKYAAKDTTVYLPDIAASNDAIVKVTVTAPGGVTPNAGEAKKVTIDGISYWAFTTNKDSKGNYTVTYTATTNEDVLTKEFKIKVGDNVAPTMSYDKGNLTQSLVYDGEHDIEYVITVDKNKKSFVVKVVNNGNEYTHNINLNIKDKDDTDTENSDYPWSNLSFELTGDKVTKGEITSTSAQYLIKGTGKYSLKLTIKDSYDNETTETIDFKVVAESKVEESNDLVVGVVLIIMSLILLAGVILFFTFTGKKGGPKSKAKKQKVAKTEVKAEKVEDKKEEVVEAKETEKVEEVKVEEPVEEIKTEETVEEVAEETTEQPKENEETNDEPKEGEVE